MIELVIKSDALVPVYRNREIQTDISQTEWESYARCFLGDDVDIFNAWATNEVAWASQQVGLKLRLELMVRFDRSTSSMTST